MKTIKHMDLVSKRKTHKMKELVSYNNNKREILTHIRDVCCMCTRNLTISIERVHTCIFISFLSPIFFCIFGLFVYVFFFFFYNSFMRTKPSYYNLLSAIQRNGSLWSSYLLLLQNKVHIPNIKYIFSCGLSHGNYYNMQCYFMFV